VEQCLLTTARDLGAPGKDIRFGHGMVQADEAYACLETKSCCPIVLSNVCSQKGGACSDALPCCEGLLCGGGTCWDYQTGRADATSTLKAQLKQGYSIDLRNYLNRRDLRTTRGLKGVKQVPRVSRLPIADA